MPQPAQVPMADLARRHARRADAIEAAVLRVLRSGRYIGGPVHAEAEAALAAHFGLAHAVGVGSGTDALRLSLQALGIGPGHRVAVPALSFFATAEAVLQTGARPVVVDVLADRPLMDPERVPEDVHAVILVHLFGARGAAPSVDAPLLSDAAQCAGWGHGPPEGRFAAVSFYPTKTLGSAGDGGLVLTDEPALVGRIRGLGSHGLTAPHEHSPLHGAVPGNSRLDTLQAAVLLAQLDDVPRRVARRRQIADHYDRELAHHRPLPRDPRDAVHHYVLRPADRPALTRALAESGVASAVYYPFPMDAQPPLSGLERPDLDASACPNAVAFCRHALAIPCHGELTDAQVDQVVAAARAAR